MESQQWVMTPMEHLPAEQRTASFAEVLLGYDASEVLAEADRCIQCLHPLCIQGCPNENPIPTFIGLVQEGRVLEAAVIDYENNALPSCTGRVCAWENQCEGHCVLNARGEGVRGGAIERFIAGYALAHHDEFEALFAQRARERAARGTSSYTDPAIPALSSNAPNTTRPTFDSTMAPAHIAQGSSVT